MDNWREYQGVLVPNLPPHVEVNTKDINSLVKQRRVYLARWTSNFDQIKKSRFWFVICDQKLELEDYSKNTRSKIRRGVKNCEVKMITKEELIDYGYSCYSKAFNRYNTKVLLSRNHFKKQLLELNSEWEFWGVYIDNKLVGYSQNRILMNCCDYSIIKFDSDYLKSYTSYALFYHMNNYYLNKKNLKYVNDGSRSISHQTNIQNFLIQKFHFRKAYCRLHVVYPPLIRLLIWVVYPFRDILIHFNFLKKINVLLLQENIRRSFM